MGEPGGLPSMGLQSRTPLKRLSSSSKKLMSFSTQLSWFCSSRVSSIRNGVERFPVWLIR